MTQILIHIRNKLFDRNKKVKDISFTTSILVIKQESRVFLSKVSTITRMRKHFNHKK